MKLDRKTWLLIAGSVTLFMLAVALTTAAISVAYRTPAGQEQPKVTDWMQAWGSVFGVFAGLAAAVAAAALLVFERRQADEARRQLAEERRTGEESRARTVITADVRFPHGGFAISSGGATRFSRVQLSVLNFGTDPIHWVVVEVVLPGSRTVEHNGTEFIAPGQREVVVILLDPSYTSIGDNPDLDAKLCEVIVTFTDSSGIRWSRRNNGIPQREAGQLLHLRDMIEVNRPSAQ
ncbi:hypothetical protein [Micromonospora sp. NPDC050200]|uniref:hypothetical protein n=1 Tax=Micromonospora sp. NPDC050200 TaxID=3155664 RepID=UPI0033C55168